MKDQDIIFKLCKAIFRIGGGSYWYEDGVIGDDERPAYKILSIILYFCYFTMTALELMAAAFGNLSIDETCHAISHGVSHTLYVFQILSGMFKRPSIKKLLHDLIIACEGIDDDINSRKKYEEIKWVLGIYTSCIIGALITYFVQGIMYVLAGQNFFIIITYYAPPGEGSTPATCFRIATTITIVAMLITMIITVNGLVITIMIIFKYKFIQLKQYFEQLGDEMAKDVHGRCDVFVASNKLCESLKQGVIMHTSLLRLSKDLDNSFGFIMTIQLFGSSFPAVFLLLQMAVSGKTDILYALQIFAFIGTVFFLLGVYLCTFGDITYEASTLPDAIFDSGWHLCPATLPAHRTIRALVLMSFVQSQLPITVKAFAMVDLTHSTYVEVIKSTYSVYALLQARNTS